MRFHLPILIALTTAGCTGEVDRNIAAARRDLARLTAGMSCADACWYVGHEQPDDCSRWGFGRDHGRTFSGREVVLRMWIRDQILVRADIIRPRYEAGVRKDGHAALIAEIGVSLADAEAR